jgi:hypothetical protein
MSPQLWLFQQLGGKQRVFIAWEMAVGAHYWAKRIDREVRQTHSVRSEMVD